MDPASLRQQFPLLLRENLIYLDNAASSQKPQCVLDAVQDVYTRHYSNVHRGAHFLGDEATDMFESARNAIHEHIGSASAREIVITKNATESINLVARSLEEMEHFAKEGDSIVLTRMEHHANMLPWMQFAQRKKMNIEYIDIDEDKNLTLENLDSILHNRVKILAFCHVSNVLGTENPVQMLCNIASQKGILTLVDACQSAPHLAINVQKMGCDFLVFSGHKMYGPGGIGILYGKKELLKKMPPFLTGGEMIREVSYEGFIPQEIPAKFEAGTPPIAETVGIGRAARFLQERGMTAIENHARELSEYARMRLQKNERITLLSHQNALGMVTFTVSGHQNYDVSDALSDRGICIRVGHHCAEPLHGLLGVKTSLRASFGIYTQREEIDIFADTLEEIIFE